MNSLDCNSVSPETGAEVIVNLFNINCSYNAVSSRHMDK